MQRAWICFSTLGALQGKSVTESQEQGKLKRKRITLRNLRQRSGLRLLIASWISSWNESNINIKYSHLTKQTEVHSLWSIWHNIHFCSFNIHLKYYAQTKLITSNFFKKIDCIIHEHFTKVIQTVPINSVAFPKNPEKFCKLPKLSRQIRQPADGCYWQVSGDLRTTDVMHCKHTQSQGVNINKADDWSQQAIDKYNKKIIAFTTVLYKVNLPDIYRLDIPTILLKPRDDNDSVDYLG